MGAPSQPGDAARGLLDVEALDQGAGGGNAQDRLAHKSSREGATPLLMPGALSRAYFFENVENLKKFRVGAKTE